MTNHATKSAAEGVSTWSTDPATGKWNTATNWTPADVPTGTGDFGASSRTAISFSSKGGATVDAIVFSVGAPSFKFTFDAPAPTAPALTIRGRGITNNSANPHHFIVASSAVSYTQPQLKFTNFATAGGANVNYAVGPTTPAAAGGGVIGFCDQSTAGSASFTVTTGAGTPVEPSTVGGEVSFSDCSSAGAARFTIHGSTSTTDGDTFGNVVFHDTSTAASAVFTNTGGTVLGGDGGNTQFYDNATAASALCHNKGGTVSGSNGGDVAFDGTSIAAGGTFHNYAATASGGYGGVTSFNNNAPTVNRPTEGASAGSGQFYNYGAKESGEGGGHTYFTAKYGSPTAAGGTFINHGSDVSGYDSLAGHTVFSITLPQIAEYAPSAGSGVFWNLPGTVAGAHGGYTQFTVYTDDNSTSSTSTTTTTTTTITTVTTTTTRLASDASNGSGPSGPSGPSGASSASSASSPSSGSSKSLPPTAGSGTFLNLGATVQGAGGGQTVFDSTASAGNAQLIATGGVNGGEGGSIVFEDQSSGGAATVLLSGNGTLDISYYGES
ncbi:MAG TPA: hypothetical protein VIJ16_10565, partial [Gemmatimonadaceae bacterium]